MRHMHTNGDTSATGHATRRSFANRHSIPEAAKALGLTEEAVRQRVKRGTLDSIKVGGSLFVLLDADTSTDREQPVKEARKGSGDTSSDLSDDTSRLVETLEDQVSHLRRQLEQANERDRENRRIIAGLVQRVPELESSSEPRDARVNVSESTINGDVPQEQQEPSQRRSWLHRFFFGE
jgi:hypothetical protein